MSHFWEIMAARGPHFLAVLLGGTVMTVKVTIGALIIALTLGLVIALLCISRFRLFRTIGTIYVELIRGTPALAQLFIIYFGLPDIGIEVSPIAAALIGLGMNGAAYVSEIYRAGIQAIHRGQMEAALSIGMTPTGALRYIVLPQALRLMLPPLGNYAITLLKDTSLVSIVAAPEIMFFARSLVTETFLSMHIYLIVAAIYLCMSIPMSRAVAHLEKARHAWR